MEVHTGAADEECSLVHESACASQTRGSDGIDLAHAPPPHREPRTLPCRDQRRKSLKAVESHQQAGWRCHQTFLTGSTVGGDVDRAD